MPIRALSGLHNESYSFLHVSRGYHDSEPSEIGLIFKPQCNT